MTTKNSHYTISFNVWSNKEDIANYCAGSTFLLVLKYFKSPHILVLRSGFGGFELLLWILLCDFFRKQNCQENFVIAVVISLSFKHHLFLLSLLLVVVVVATS